MWDIFKKGTQSRCIYIYIYTNYYIYIYIYMYMFLYKLAWVVLETTTCQTLSDALSWAPHVFHPHSEATLYNYSYFILSSVFRFHFGIAFVIDCSMMSWTLRHPWAWAKNHQKARFSELETYENSNTRVFNLRQRLIKKRTTFIKIRSAKCPKMHLSIRSS